MSHKTGKFVKCEKCGKEVYRSGAKLKKSKHYFCSSKCHDKYREIKVVQYCQYCGKKLIRVPSIANRNQKIIACGFKCLAKLFKGINHSGFFKKGNIGDKCINYKEGKQDANGYKMVLLYNHPLKTAKGYVYEHRVVLEKKLGRYLEPQEVVHHIDGNKLNNDVDNLMLFNNVGEHTRYHRILKK